MEGVACGRPLLRSTAKPIALPTYFFIVMCALVLVHV